MSQLRSRLTAERQLHALALLAAAAGLAEEALTLWQVSGLQLEPSMGPSRLGLQVTFLCIWSAYPSPLPDNNPVHQPSVSDTEHRRGWQRWGGISGGSSGAFCCVAIRRRAHGPGAGAGVPALAGTRRATGGALYTSGLLIAAVLLAHWMSCSYSKVQGGSGFMMAYCRAADRAAGNDGLRRAAGPP